MHWFDIPGWLKIIEGQELQILAYQKYVLEIGSLFGRSTVCMAAVATHIDAVDPHNGLSIEPQYEYHGMDTYQQFSNNISTFNNICPIRAYIEDLELESNKYSFAFIDGDHSYEACTRDISIVKNCLIPGSYFAVHDYYSGSKHHHGVIKAVNEYCKEYGVILRRVKSLAILS